MILVLTMDRTRRLATPSPGTPTPSTTDSLSTSIRDPRLSAQPADELREFPALNEPAYTGHSRELGAHGQIGATGEVTSHGRASSTQTIARRSVSTKLRGLEIPEAFASATVATEALLLARTRRTQANAADLRRTADKARRLERGAA